MVLCLTVTIVVLRIGAPHGWSGGILMCTYKDRNGSFEHIPQCTLIEAIFNLLHKPLANWCMVCWGHAHHVVCAIGVEFTHFVSYHLACYPNPNRNPSPNTNPNPNHNPNHNSNSNPDSKLGRLFLKMCELYLFSVTCSMLLMYTAQLLFHQLPTRQSD